jgi:hypothetical protein
MVWKQLYQHYFTMQGGLRMGRGLQEIAGRKRVLVRITFRECDDGNQGGNQLCKYMIFLHLLRFLRYTPTVPEIGKEFNQIPKGLPTMKLIVRVVAVMVVIAGFAAASMSSASTKNVVSHQTATAHMPLPGCGPYVPTCGMHAH